MTEEQKQKDFNAGYEAGFAAAGDQVEIIFKEIKRNQQFLLLMVGMVVVTLLLASIYQPICKVPQQDNTQEVEDSTEGRPAVWSAGHHALRDNSGSKQVISHFTGAQEEQTGSADLSGVLVDALYWNKKTSEQYRTTDESNHRVPLFERHSPGQFKHG